MRKSPIQRLLNLLCAGLAFLFLFLQFMPFWYSETEQITMSIQGFMWNIDLHEGLQSELGLRTIVDFAMPFSEFFLCILGIVFCLIMSSSKRIAIIPLICGLVGIWGYTMSDVSAVYRMNSIWVVQFIVAIVLTVVAIMALAFGHAESVKAKKAKQNK